jgi:hypothetical protein
MTAVLASQPPNASASCGCGRAIAANRPAFMRRVIARSPVLAGGCPSMTLSGSTVPAGELPVALARQGSVAPGRVHGGQPMGSQGFAPVTGHGRRAAAYCPGTGLLRALSSASTTVASAAPIRWNIVCACRSSALARVVWPTTAA